MAVQILQILVTSRWNALPREQCEGIKNYVVTLLIRNSSDDAKLRAERILLGKLNLLLVEILKHEWPKHWPTFIGELVASSRTNLSLCENNMAIFRLLSEELFDFGADRMTTVKSKNLKQQLNKEFAEIFSLCSEILDKATKPSLVQATLAALLRFLRWIPLGYIFETNLVECLLGKFLTALPTRNLTIQCLIEILSLPASPETEERVVRTFATFQETLGAAILPYSPALDTELPASYARGSDDDQKLAQNIAMLFASTFSTHLRLLEQRLPRETILLGHRYLIALSLVEDREMFKVCLEYWSKLCADLYNEHPFGGQVDLSPLMLGNAFGQPNNPNAPRRSIYSQVLSRLRVVMIERMAKPEEVLIVEDENGEIVRERIKETDTVALYKSMREVLVYLTHLDYADTEAIMTEKLSRQFDGSEWSWGALNRLCWAIGSISGAMNEEVEKRFLVNIIRDLLGLVEIKRGKDNKAVVASNIMYIVGQYPRFLRAHWKFLKTVANKLFEFMHETHEGVQDMACDTFQKIAKKCKRCFVQIQTGEHSAFIGEIITNLPSIISELAPAQVHSVYESLGHIISAQTDYGIQTHLLGQLLSLPNESWDHVMTAAAHDVNSVLGNSDTLKSLSNILRTNVAVSGAVGPVYITQLGRIFMDSMSLYRAVSTIISDQVAKQGPVAVKTPMVRALRAVKKDVLRLVESFVQNCSPEPAFIRETFVPPLFEAILCDYNQNVEGARDAEVLSLAAAIFRHFGDHIGEQVGPVLDSVQGCTLTMISRDLTEYPEHRRAYFDMLSAMIQRCLVHLLRLTAIKFKTIIDSMVWAFKHTHREIADCGLSMTLDLLVQMQQQPAELKSSFYSVYFMPILQDVFFVLTDMEHKTGMLLFFMFF